MDVSHFSMTYDPINNLQFLLLTILYESLFLFWFNQMICPLITRKFDLIKLSAP